MNLEKVVFGFFVLLAATLNFGFFIGDIADPALHNVYELFAAIVVSLIATVLKFGDRTQIGAVHLATSLVADLQLIAAALVWTFADGLSAAGPDPGGDGERGVAVRRRAVRQRRLGGAAGRRDRLLPPPLRGARVGNPLLAFWWRMLQDDELPQRMRRLDAAAVLGAGLGDDLPGPAPDAGAADRADHDLRGQRARA